MTITLEERRTLTNNADRLPADGVASTPSEHETTCESPHPMASRLGAGAVIAEQMDQAAPRATASNPAARTLGKLFGEDGPLGRPGVKPRDRVVEILEAHRRGDRVDTPNRN